MKTIASCNVSSVNVFSILNLGRSLISDLDLFMLSFPSMILLCLAAPFDAKDVFALDNVYKKPGIHVSYRLVHT